MKGLVLNTLLLCTIYIYNSGATLTKLADGIRVYKGPSTRIVEGTWTLLLTIREPGQEYRNNERRSLIRDVNILLDAVRRENETLTLTPKRKKVLLRRLNLILLDRDLHYQIQGASRRRRGLIDAGGWLLNKVFGTATQQQIEDVKDQLNSAAQQRGAVVHNTARLITIVNQTRLEATATRVQLNRLGAAHGQFVTDELARWTTFQVMTRYNLLHQMVESLCDLDEGLNRELLAIDNLHTTIRQGRVTEGICIRDIGDGGYVVLTLGDEYTLSCRGEHQQRHQLEMGTYLVQLNDQCVMTGSAWRLMGEIHQFVNATAEKTGMTIPELDLAAMVPAEWHINNNITRNRDFNDFNNLNDDNMNALMNQMENMNGSDGYDEVWISHNVAWGALGIVLYVGMVLILGGRYIYIKRKKIHYFLADAKSSPVKPPRAGTSQDRLTEEIEMT